LMLKAAETPKVKPFGSGKSTMGPTRDGRSSTPTLWRRNQPQE
jgi:hypothetical protein